MKKTYQLNVKNKTTDRVVDSIKHEVKKYIARERRKELPELVDFWDFDCKIGENEKAAANVHLSKVNEMISKIAAAENESFYLEILVKPARRMKK
ncbi:MAG: hypothetical protein HON90_01770 [Halobacteriovoraceae bacterium]|jgi:hypothetical protein|nr:hypothetical protein [Halobacteriovoraceae bacterium]